MPCVCLGFMSALMSRPNRQGDSSGVIGGRSFCSYLCLAWVFFFPECLHLFPTDSAWQHGSPGFQELKAEVTEVPAPDSSPDSTGLTVNPLQEQTNTVTFSKDNEFQMLVLGILRTSKKDVPSPNIWLNFIRKENKPLAETS